MTLVQLYPSDPNAYAPRRGPRMQPGSREPFELDGPDDSVKWGNIIRTDLGLQNSPRASLRVLNFEQESRTPAARVLTLSYETPRFQPGTVPDGLDIHPVARVSGGTGAGAFTFELDWVHGTQFVFSVTSVHIDLTFDLPVSEEQIPIPEGLLFGAFISPFGSPGAVRPVRTRRLGNIPPSIGGSLSTVIPTLARRWRVYVEDSTEYASFEQHLWRDNTPSVIASTPGGEQMDIFGPAQIAAAVNLTDETIVNAWAVFELSA